MDTTGTMPMEKGGSCSCPHHKMVPAMKGLAIIVFGGAFLLVNLSVISPFARDVLWPLAIVVFGVGQFAAVCCTCCSSRRGCCH